MTALLLGESRIVLETERLAADRFLIGQFAVSPVSPLLLALAEAAGKQLAQLRAQPRQHCGGTTKQERGGQRHIFFVIAVPSASSPMTSSLESSRRSLCHD